MRNLWKGLALLAIDTDLRGQVTAKAKFDVRPDLEPALRNQPSLPALRDIDAVFRTRGVFLAAYELAEINRWVLDGGKKFDKALDDFKTAIQTSLAVGGIVQSPGFLESVGVLVADPQLRDHFGKRILNLRDQGFQITKAEEDALRTSFGPGTTADRLADVIFNLGWSGTSCLGTDMPYEGMIHTNR
jgi:hypothetical protein